MGRINNLNQGDFGDFYRRLHALETATPMNNAAIGRSGLEIYDGGTLTISNGGLVVNGSAQIIGTLNADGTINMTGLFVASGTVQLHGTVVATGDFNIDGPLIVDGNTIFNGTLGINGVTTIAGDTTVTGKFVTNGPVDINGLTKIAGSLDVSGITTLTGDLNVTGSGKIKAGVTQINPDGTISFGSGKRVTPDNGFGFLALESGAASMQLTPANADYHAQFSGGLYAQGLIRGMGLRLAALPTTTQPANLHIDSSGNVSRSTA